LEKGAWGKEPFFKKVFSPQNVVMRQYGCKKSFLNLKGTFLFCVNKEEKCQEKVWKKRVEFEEGEKDLPSKGLFPLLKYF